VELFIQTPANPERLIAYRPRVLLESILTGSKSRNGLAVPAPLEHNMAILSETRIATAQYHPMLGEMLGVMIRLMLVLLAWNKSVSSLLQTAH